MGEVIKALPEPSSISLLPMQGGAICPRFLRSTLGFIERQRGMKTDRQTDRQADRQTMVGGRQNQEEDDNFLLSSEKHPPPKAEGSGEQAPLAPDTTAFHPG